MYQRASGKLNAFVRQANCMDVPKRHFDECIFLNLNSVIDERCLRIIYDDKPSNFEKH